MAHLEQINSTLCSLELATEAHSVELKEVRELVQQMMPVLSGIARQQAEQQQQLPHGPEAANVKAIVEQTAELVLSLHESMEFVEARLDASEAEAAATRLSLAWVAAEVGSLRQEVTDDDLFGERCSTSDGVTAEQHSDDEGGVWDWQAEAPPRTEATEILPAAAALEQAMRDCLGEHFLKVPAGMRGVGGHALSCFREGAADMCFRSAGRDDVLNGVVALDGREVALALPPCVQVFTPDGHVCTTAVINTDCSPAPGALERICLTLTAVAKPAGADLPPRASAYALTATVA